MRATRSERPRRRTSRLPRSHRAASAGPCRSPRRSRRSSAAPGSKPGGDVLARATRQYMIARVRLGTRRGRGCHPIANAAVAARRVSERTAARLRSRSRPRRSSPLLGLRDPHHRLPRLGREHGCHLVHLVGDHHGGVLRALRPRDRGAGRGLAGRGRGLRLGARRARPTLGLDVCLDLLDQQRLLDPRRLPGLRRHLPQHLPEGPARGILRRGLGRHLAGGGHRDPAHLAHGRRRDRAPRGLEVAAQPGRRGQGRDLPGPRRPRSPVPALGPDAGERLQPPRVHPELGRRPRLPAHPPLQHPGLRADELGRRGDERAAAGRAPGGAALRRHHLCGLHARALWASCSWCRSRS